MTFPRLGFILNRTMRSPSFWVVKNPDILRPFEEISTVTRPPVLGATSRQLARNPPGIIPPGTESDSPVRAYGPAHENKSALTDEEQKLVTLLTKKQQENLKKLEAAWEKAPDWLKPLIRQAIELILYGYDASISNLSY